MFEAYAEFLAHLHQEAEKLIADLPPDALNWQPLPEMNSIAVLIVHLTGAERYWIGDVAASDPSDRDRDAEFEVTGLDAEALIERLRASDEYIASAINAFSLDDLLAERTSPRDGRTFTVGWALLHALEHTAMHVGHIQMTRQILESS
jgi:uncharacterized damage-inducible protein DinB